MKIAALNLRRNFHCRNGAEWNIANHREAIPLDRRMHGQG